MGPEQIRNVALVGHGGSGKTSLAEALLFVAGSTTRLGNVDSGTSLFDYEPEEQERKISLGLAVASVEWSGHRINLVDAPGYADFFGDARAALRAADLALFVVSAVDGVEVGTELMWRAAGEEGIPRAVFITKLDRDRASFQRTLDQLREAFGKGIAPIQVPVGEEHDLRGMARVVSERVYLYGDGATRGELAETIPDGSVEIIHAAHTALIESVVETDEAMMERYFEGIEPERPVIVETVHRGMLSGDIFPVLVGSATRLVGVDILAEFLVDYAPHPLERSLPATDGVATPAPDGPCVAQVFKTISDPFVGRISVFRVFSGSLAHDDVLEMAAGGQARMHNLFRLQGKDHADAAEVTVGDIAAVAKIDDLHTGSTLRTPGSGVELTEITMPRPVMEVAISPRSTQDDDKLSMALHRLAEEDPTISIEQRAETHETIMSGLGDMHLDVSIERLARRYGVEVDTRTPRIPYRETFTASAQVEGKHKKQSGGRGQFGVAALRFTPRPRGSGYEYVDSIKGGSIPRSFIPAVDKGVQEALERGILAGYPVVDVAAEVLDGKYHPVDSDEMSFRMAGIQAVKSAAAEVKPVLLEPIVRLTVRAPEEYTGDIMGDINAKRGRVLGMDTDGSMRVVTAEAPMAEVQRYAIDLRSMTSGRGTFEMVFDHYEEMPAQEAQRVVAATAVSED